MTRHNGLRIALTSCFLVEYRAHLGGRSRGPGQQDATWLATLTSPGAATAAFQTVADKAALAAAAQLTAGQDVMLRWDGAKKGEAQGITAIRAIESPADAASGQETWWARAVGHARRVRGGRYTRARPSGCRYGAAAPDR